MRRDCAPLALSTRDGGCKGVPSTGIPDNPAGGPAPGPSDVPRIRGKVFLRALGRQISTRPAGNISRSGRPEIVAELRTRSGLPTNHQTGISLFEIIKQGSTDTQNSPCLSDSIRHRGRISSG